jgi:hypothetical protein
MSLLLATLLPGLVLALLGGALLANRAGVNSAMVSWPRSPTATVVLFGGAAVWFLWLVWNLSTADFGDYHVLLTIGFAAVAVLSFKCVPDFLAVRGLCALMLLVASPLLRAAFMHYEHPQRLFMVTPVFILIALSIWLGVQPYRMRDFLGWLFAKPTRARGFGAALLGYGLLLVAVAFTY